MIGQSQHYVLGIVMPQNVGGVHVNVRAMREIGLNESPNISGRCNRTVSKIP